MGDCDLTVGFTVVTNVNQLRGAWFEKRPGSTWVGWLSTTHPQKKILHYLRKVPMKKGFFMFPFLSRNTEDGKKHPQLFLFSKGTSY